MDAQLQTAESIVRAIQMRNGAQCLGTSTLHCALSIWYGWLYCSACPTVESFGSSVIVCLDTNGMRFNVFNLHLRCF